MCLIEMMSVSGPHCFIVPIRDLNGVMWPGVTTIDMKHKEGNTMTLFCSTALLNDDLPDLIVLLYICFYTGLNGVDNGILIFNNVRIPRENLLGK